MSKNACWNDGPSAQSELCMVPEKDTATRRALCLTHLYELRLQLATAKEALSRTKDLSAALHASNAHDEVCRAVTAMETAHPELT